MTEVRAYNANPTDATAKCGPIAEWDVSAITDMGQLFYNLRNFDADVSNWDTSSVTTMYQMFYVRSSPCPAPNLQSSPALHAACTAVARRLPPADPHTSPRTVRLIPFFRLSAERKLPVQRQQAAHPLRVEGHLSLRLRWLWLELGSGKLPRLKIGCMSS